MVQATRDGRLGGPAQVERDLLDLATSGAPEQLRSGIRERQQAADGAAMLRDEQRQRSARAFHLARRDSGMWDVRGALPDEVGQQFAIALDAFDQPDPDSTPLLERRRPEQRRADALAALVGVAMDRGFAPGTGGIVRPHVSVIVPATTFTADLAAPPSRPDDGHGDGDDLGSDDQAVGIDDPAWTALAAGDLERGGSCRPRPFGASAAMPTSRESS